MLSPFDRELHLGEVQRWAINQGVEPMAPDSLPAAGVIEPGVAVGWLYQTDSKVGFLEQFVTNPEAPGRARLAAVDAIASALMAQAKGLGITKVVAMTRHRSIGRIAIRHGFTYAGPMHVLAAEV
jgi:hypothetical protein